MNKQEIFDKVVTHLKNQNARAYDKEEDRCLYRDESTGYRCAIGCLIPDELYNPDFEGESIDTLLEKAPVLKELLKIKNFSAISSDVMFLRRLQSIHDGGDLKDWPMSFRNLAVAYELKWNHEDWLKNETAS
jgi:hypothetical protein